jgi:hypothetical protein
MRSIHHLIDHPLTLLQPKIMKLQYELRFGDEIIAKVTFPKVLSKRAEVVTADGTWTISREGFFKRTIRAIREGESHDSAVCSSNYWKDKTTIIFSDRTKYFVKSNLWKSLTEIRKETGEVVISMKTEGFLRNTTRITMNRTAAITPALPLLVMLGIYLEILTRRDSHAKVVACGI